MSDPRSPKMYKLLRVKATTLAQYRQLRWAFKNVDMATVEIHEDADHGVATELQAIIDTGVTYGSWVRVPVRHRKTRQMITDYELVLKSPNEITVDKERMDVAPMTWAAIDIECDSPSGRFPSPEEKECKIIMIGVAVRNVDGSTDQILFRLKSRVDPIDTSEYVEHVFETEVDMLWALWEAIMVLDFRMLVTFNGDRFDWKYILRRVYNLEMDVDLFTTLGVDLTEKWPEIRTGRGRDAVMLEPVDAAEGKDHAVTFNVPGRIGLDMRFLFQKTLNGVPRYRFKRYALDPVAERLLGTHKLDVPASEMFRIWKEGIGRTSPLLQLLHVDVQLGRYD